MKTYTHDYKKVARAQKVLGEALEAVRSDNLHGAGVLICLAKGILDEYLAGDNMLPDDDLADGWVKHSDAIAAVKESLNMYFESMKKIEEANQYLAENESDF